MTTSRDPSTRLTQFAKEMKLVIPNAQRLNRGGQVSAAQGKARGQDGCSFITLGVWYPIRMGRYTHSARQQSRAQWPSCRRLGWFLFADARGETPGPLS